MYKIRRRNQDNSWELFHHTLICTSLFISNIHIISQTRYLLRLKKIFKYYFSFFLLLPRVKQPNSFIKTQWIVNNFKFMIWQRCCDDFALFNSDCLIEWSSIYNVSSRCEQWKHYIHIFHWHESEMWLKIWA